MYQAKVVFVASKFAADKYNSPHYRVKSNLLVTISSKDTKRFTARLRIVRGKNLFRCEDTDVDIATLVKKCITYLFMYLKLEHTDDSCLVKKVNKNT